MGVAQIYRAVAGVGVRRLTRDGLPIDPEGSGLSLMLDEADRLHLAIADELFRLDPDEARFLSRELARFAGEAPPEPTENESVENQ